MDKDRQAFVELCDLVEPMQNVYRNISHTGRGLHTKLKRARGREMSDLCSNMQGVTYQCLFNVPNVTLVP